VNWKRITAAAAILFVAQFMLGFFESDYVPAGWSTVAVSCLASFVICGGIFALLSLKQTSRPFAHAWAALALQAVAAIAISQALLAWLDPVPSPFAVLEWLVLIFALLVGTTVGITVRRSSD
jgi:hypothetical protein